MANRNNEATTSAWHRFLDASMAVIAEPCADMELSDQMRQEEECEALHPASAPVVALGAF